MIKSPSIEELSIDAHRTKLYLNKHYPGFVEWLQNRYPFAESLNECLYNYINRPEATSRPTCPVCGKYIKYNNCRKYTTYCSKKCGNADPKKLLRVEQTCLQKYGYKHAVQAPIISYKISNKLKSEESRNKYKQVCLERYGVDNSAKSTSSRKKLSEKHSSSETQQKMKNTCLEKYGVEYVFQSESVKNKIKENNLQKYGVEYYNQSDEGRIKLSEKHCSTETQNKYKQTCLKRYGVGNYSQSQDRLSRYNEIRNKYEETCLNKYGVEYYTQSEEYQYRHDEFQNKSKQTCLKRYGVGNYSQSEEFQSRYNEIQTKVKQTCLDKYGVEHSLQFEEIRNKIKQTCLDKYGTENYTQSQEYQSRHDEIQTKINNTKRLNHTFNSSKIESEFANYLTSQNIEYIRQYRSKEYPFNCDFYLPKYDLYVEIQAGWFHGFHQYNEELDKDILETWKSKNTDFYKTAIETWTKRDVKKREIAKQNQLNYLEIFSNDLDEVVKHFQKRI